MQQNVYRYGRWYRSTADAQHDHQHEVMHLRPRIGKTADDRVEPKARTRGGRKNGKRPWTVAQIRDMLPAA